MPLINSKGESKIKWTKYCVSSAAGADNTNSNNPNNIIFTIKDTKLYVVVPLSTKDNHSKLYSKVFERSVYWNENKTESENKNMTNEYRYFLEINFVGINGLCFSLFKSRCQF